MNKDNKDNKEKIIFSNKLFPNLKKKTINHLKRNHKNLKIKDPNSNYVLNSLNNGYNLTTQNCINSKIYLTLDEKLENNNKNINTEKIFYKKYYTSHKIIQNKNTKKILNRTNIKEDNKTLHIETNNSKTKKNITPNKSKNRLTKNNDKKNFYKLNISNNININNFNIYQNYNQIKKNNISKTSRNNDSSSSGKNKINNIMYILNKKNNKSSIKNNKSRNNIKLIYNKKNKKNNFNSSIDSKFSYNDKNPYKKKSINQQNCSHKSKIINKPKSKDSKIKIRNLTVFNSNNNINNKSKEIKSEPKKLNIIKKKKGAKIINFVDLIKSKENKNSNVIIKKIKYYNLNNVKNSKNYEKETKNNIHIIKGINNKVKEKLNININIKSKTNNNSKEKKISYKNIKKNNKSCDISLLKLKKKNKKNSKIMPIQLQLNNKKKFLQKNNPPFVGDNSCTKIVSVSNNIKEFFNKKEKKKIKKDMHTYNFEDKCYNNILESDNENNNKIINEIKINQFNVKKPNEENMKYTSFKEFIDEIKEDKSNTIESHISKIIIGEIDGYNDIIEKDKINDLLKNNININNINIKNNSGDNDNKIKKIKNSFIDFESDKKLINMINFEDEIDNIDNMSTNDIKNDKFKEPSEKIVKNIDINNKQSNIKAYPSGKKLNSMRCPKNDKYNPIKYREKIDKKINIKIDNQKKLLKYKSNIKLKKIIKTENNTDTNTNAINLNNNSKKKVEINNNQKCKNKNKNKNIQNDLLNNNKRGLNKNIEQNNNNHENCFII